MCDLLKQLKEAQAFADRAIEKLSAKEPVDSEVLSFQMGIAQGIKLLNAAIYEEVFPFYHPLGEAIKSYEDYREWHHRKQFSPSTGVVLNIAKP